MKCVLFGSMAYDHLFFTDAKFADIFSRLDTDQVNFSMLSQKYTVERGGTAGNIAYYLSLLGEKPSIVTSLGNDIDHYIDSFEDMGIDFSSSFRADKKSPHAHIFTDIDGNQINNFFPGSLVDANMCDVTAPDPRYVSISPGGDLQAMRQQISLCRAHDVPYIFDPGQMLHTWGRKALREDISAAVLLMFNEYEWKIFEEISGYSIDDLQDQQKNVIITKGAQGSRYFLEGQVYDVGIAEPEQVVNPTGCGDAFRAGVYHALYHENQIVYGMKIGAVLASFAIESPAPQHPTLTAEMIHERCQFTFGVSPNEKLCKKHLT